MSRFTDLFQETSPEAPAPVAPEAPAPAAAHVPSPEVKSSGSKKTSSKKKFTMG